MTLRLWGRWIQVVALATFVVWMAGCINVAPLPYGAQKEEAKNLGKLLKSVNKDAREVVLSEHKLARELRVILDELAKLPQEDFRKRFQAYAGEMVSIQEKRRELLKKFDGRYWKSSMVQEVQHGAVQQIKGDMARTSGWIEMTEGVRLRVELGRTEGFPELSMLTHQLDIFLSARADLDPMGARILALQDAFRLHETDFN